MSKTLIRQTKTILFLLLIIALLAQVGSCTKDYANLNIIHQDTTIHYQNRVAQDSNYRKGKWYSISDGAGYGFTVSPLLDTIWFISDSLAGWTHTVPSNVHAYSFRKTYFKDNYHIVFLAQNVDTPSKMDSVVLLCGITSLSQDTFCIFWYNWGQLFQENYVKLKE